MLKTDSRRRSAVGRISREEGEASRRTAKPGQDDLGNGVVPITKSLPPIPRPQIALAVIAALGAAGRAVAVGFVLVARARLVAAGTLHQHAATLAIGNQRAFD